MTAFEFLAFLYLGMAFLKFCLVLPTFYFSIKVYKRLHGQQACLPLFIILLPIVCVFMWPLALQMERGRFFFIYSRISTYKQILKAYA